MAYYWLIGWYQLRISGHAYATHSSPPRGEWSALTSVTHHDDAVDGCPCRGLHLNNRPLLSLLLAKFASSTGPQKPPATYTRVNDFGLHTDSIFRGRLIREGDLYASIYGKSFFAYTVKSANPQNTYRDRLHNIISSTSHVMANFVFKFITFRYYFNKGWSSERLNDNVQLANTEIRCKNVGHMSQIMANLVLKFPRCCCHSTRGHVAQI